MVNSLNEIYLRNKKPLSLKLEITNSCNLKCVHCYVRDEKVTFLDKEYILDILKQAKKLGVIFLHISGGECLIHPDFSEIYMSAHKLGFKIVVLTNGTLFTDAIIDMFSKNRPYLIEISVYGTNQNICNAVTGDENAYKHTFKNIHKLKACNLNMLLKYILMGINKNSLIPFMIFAQKYNLKYRVYYNIMPTKNNKQWIDLQIEPFLRELLNFYTIEDYNEKIEMDMTTTFKECNAGITFFNINCYGKLYFCDFLGSSVEVIADLNDAISKLKKRRNTCIVEKNMKKCAKCSKSTVCDTCIATLANDLKFNDNCYTASYRYDIKNQLKELREL